MASSSEETPRLSAVEIQQEYYEAIGDADWELYEKKDRQYLLQKVAIALCGPPTIEGNLVAEADLKLQGYGTREEEITDKVFNKICEQAKYSQDSENIFISIIRVVCVTPSEPVPLLKITPPNYWVDLHTKKTDVIICLFHVFSLRKCIPNKHGVQGCRIFIDHDGRVYQNWNSYLTENNLPKCVLVVPENGQYKGRLDPDFVGLTEIMPSVKYQVMPSPALGIGARVLSVTDTVSTVANIGALVGVAGGLLLPAAAPVAFGTAVGVGVVTGVYGIVRSSIHLADRKKHEQSIGLTSPEARASWINIVVSTAGISVSGATRLLSAAAASGTNVTILLNAVRVLQYTNLGAGFIGIANSLVDMVMRYTKYNETPTKLEIFQFTTSALFFGIGAISNQTAQEIVQDAQARTINEIRDSLPSNVKKKMFDKVTAETRRVQGTIKGNADVIRGLQKIDNKNDFFAKLAGINKQMNKNKLRISLSPDGNPLINNQYKVGVNELHGLGKSGRSQLFSKYGPAKVTTKNAPTRIYASGCSTSSVSTVAQETRCFIRPEEILKISSFLLSLSKVDQNVIENILAEITSEAHDAFLLLCAELIAALLPFELDILFSLDRDYKVRIILYVFNYIKSQIHIDDDTDISFANIVKAFIKNGRIDVDKIRRIKEKLMQRTYERTPSSDDPRDYDDLYNFRKSRSIGFVTLEAGETVTIGSHEILVKASTTEKLADWLENCSQEQCDAFLSLCYAIITSLKKTEIDKLIQINFDEDIILRIAHFLLFDSYYEIFDILMGTVITDTDLISDIAAGCKEELLRWRNLQTIRKFEKCDVCTGIRFL